MGNKLRNLVSSGALVLGLLSPGVLYGQEVDADVRRVAEILLVQGDPTHSVNPNSGHSITYTMVFEKGEKRYGLNYRDMGLSSGIYMAEPNGISPEDNLVIDVYGPEGIEKTLRDIGLDGNVNYSNNPAEDQREYEEILRLILGLTSSV